MSNVADKRGLMVFGDAVQSVALDDEGEVFLTGADTLKKVEMLAGMLETMLNNENDINFLGEYATEALRNLQTEIEEIRAL